MTESNRIDAPEAVAIVGMAGRFPRARSLDEFWAHLAAGRELVTFFTDEELLSAGVSADLLRDPNYVKARAVLEDAELFDAAFFGINPREADLIDPQQRVFLECAWEALEHAGYDSERYDGAIGVFAGLSMNGYLLNNLVRNPDLVAASGAFQLMISGDKDFLATRASYKLNLRGPSVNVQSACSTSLVAVQLACQSLLSFQCDLAMAGGVSVGSPRAFGHLYQPGMIMSPDGHCRPFDAGARGIVAGEGAGLIVLKRLSEALADGDTIHAIVRGAAVNNDGSQKVGFTAPSVDGQAEVIAMAQAMGAVAPDTISYVEAHGTGTELGDPIEVAALTQAFRAGTDQEGYCALGSVKSNMGHLDAAAGIAGLLKTVLALKHQQIPPSLHFEAANPNIDFARSPFYVNTELQPWTTRDGVPRRAGVSSFGIGGTNAHVVLEEAPARPQQPSSRPSQVLLVSARTPGGLERATDALAQHLRQAPELDLADVAYTLQVGRRIFSERRVLVVSNDAQAAAHALETRDPRKVFSVSSGAARRPVAFLFTGQGSQYINMARELYASEPVFRAEVDRCAAVLAEEVGLDIRRVLYPAPADETWASAQLAQTAWTQPALFVTEYALARLWMSWGVQPRAMLGHSIGEYVAACLAGVFELEDVLRLVAERGRLIQALPPGSMLAVSLAHADLLPMLGPELSVAGVNAPGLTVVSGASPLIDALKANLEQRDIACRPLHTSHAFHSPMMDPILQSFRECVSRTTRHAPSLEFVSNLSGTWITPREATDVEYWVAHLRSAVQFEAGAAKLLGGFPDLVTVEMGPGALTSLLKQHPARLPTHLSIAAMRHPQDVTSDHARLMEAVGRVWLAGVDIDWQSLHAPEQRQRVALPTYPFERQRYWVEPRATLAEARPRGAQADQTMPGRRDDLTTWSYQPSWSRYDLPRSTHADQPSLERQNWLILADRTGLGDRLARELAERGQDVVRVTQAEAFICQDRDSYAFPANDRDSYDHLLRQLRAAGRAPAHVVHMWNVGPRPGGAEPVALDEWQPAQDAAFYSLLYLAQALGEPNADVEVRIDVITGGACDVTGDEDLLPSRALALGPARVIPQEYPGITCRVVDLSLDADVTDSAGVVLQELLASPSEPLVAIRKAHRWVARYEPLPLPTEQPSVLRERGVYLITGGLGAVGLELAEYLATAVREARIVLLGRRGLPERAYWSAWVAEHGPDEAISRRVRKVQALEALGAQVLVIGVDVCDATGLRAAIERVHRHFGPISGVIHAAGVAGGGIIPLKTREIADQVLAPKVLGTTLVADALEGEPLDFFVLCSSLTSVLGGAGQVDYCAANSYLSAYAHARNRSRGGAVAIDWAAWQEVGMAVDTPIDARLQSFKDANLRNGIRSAEARQILARILGSGLAEVLVSPQDLLALRAWHARSTAPEPSAAEVALPTATHERPQLATDYVAPSGEVEVQIAEVWQALLGITDVGVHDSFFDLGGHSLLATQLLGRLQRRFGIDISLRTIFESPTIAELARRIGTTPPTIQDEVSSARLSSDDRIEIEL